MNEPAEPIDSTEPLEPIDRIEPAEPIDRIDPADPIDSRLPAEKALAMLNTEPKDQREPTLLLAVIAGPASTRRA